MTTTPSSTETAAPSSSSSITIKEAGTAAINSFISALPSTESQTAYPNQLNLFFDFLELPGTSLEERAGHFLDRSKRQEKYILTSLTDYLAYLKKRVNVDRNLGSGTLHTYFSAVKLFYIMNDLGLNSINWIRISKGLPKGNFVANDRAPTLEEIRKVAEYPDRRIKPIIYVMCSSGIRLGAWQYLKWKHVTPIKNEKDEIITAKLLVYAKEKESYYTFITPEAYFALKNYMDFRASHGEKITGESWLIRDKFQSTDVKNNNNNNNNNDGNKLGLATIPKPLTSSGLKKLLHRAIGSQNLRPELAEGETRYEWKMSHGYRKFFKSNAEQVMNALNVALLMNHKSGISDNYWRPKEKEVLQDYLKAVEFLTINDRQATLQKQVTELKQKGEEQNYVIKGRLAEREKEIQEMQNKLAILEHNMLETHKLYSIESGNLMVVPNEQDPDRFEIHAYNEKTRRLEPINEKQVKKIFNVKKGEEIIVEIEPTDDDKKPFLPIDDKNSPVKQQNIFNMIVPYNRAAKDEMRKGFNEKTK